MIEREAFKQWLGSLEPSTPVGHSRDHHECPLASFLIAQGKRDVIVGRRNLMVDGKIAPVPEWASMFIAWADDGRVYRSALTAEECLSFFRGEEADGR
jgi:hypothetical protein